MDLIHDFGPYQGTATQALYQMVESSLRYSTVVAPAAMEDAKVVAATTTWKREPR